MKCNTDVFWGSMFTIFGFFILMTAINFPAGPSILPKVVSIILIVLSLLLLARGVINIKKNKAQYKNVSDVFNLKVLIFGLLVLGFVLLVKHLGFLVSSMLFTFGVYYFLGFRKLKIYVGGLIFVLISFFVFSVLLDLRLPVGNLIKGIF